MEGPEAYPLSIVWLRRDLRLDDNAALYAACLKSRRVCVAFVVDRTLLAEPRMGAPLAAFFFDALGNLRGSLRAAGSDLLLIDGDPRNDLPRLAQSLGARALFFNEDYEPFAIERDRRVTEALENCGIDVHVSLDHVYFGADEIQRPEGGAYRMFAPYKRRWLDQRAIAPRPAYPSARALTGKLLKDSEIPEKGTIPQTFRNSGIAAEAPALSRLEAFLESTAERYRIDRNVPAIEGTSRLSPHLRAGTIGIRTCVEAAFSRREELGGEARAGIDAWIAELIWRDFYQMIFRAYPIVAAEPFLDAARKIIWRKPGTAFDAWCEGRTGYPIVDAAMRQLNSEGWMHNRLRMITASFLAKHLLIDWRLGERHFERSLIDADPAQNNGGWQWAASTGADAAPYFRIFNPTAQTKQYDPDGSFIRRYVGELGTARYPAPIVDHDAARRRALAVYGAAFKRPLVS